MGQKVNPIGLRLGINRTWDSRWYAGKNEYGKLLHEDMAIRAALMKALKQAAVSKIIIERPHKKCRVTIYSARPGVVIGKKGADIDKIRKGQRTSRQFATRRLAGADRRRRDRNDATRVIVRARCNAGAERRGGQQQRKKGGERFHRAGGTITHLMLTLRAIVIPCPQKVIFGCGQAAIRSRFAPATISR